MFDVSIRKLMEAGAHFGHQTRRWNPKMKPFIFGARNGVHIIDLDQTLGAVKRAYEFAVQTVENGQQVLFVGTKRQAQQIIMDAANRAQMPYVVFRWLGGTLTNFNTIRNSMDRLNKLEETVASEEKSAHHTKKELIEIGKEIERLRKNLSGIATMKRLPGAVFVIDPKTEKIAVAESNREIIPVISVVDTNCDPDGIDYIVPGNDDAIKAVELFANVIADACIEGRRRFEERIQREGREARERERQSREQSAGGEEKLSTAVFINPRIASTLQHSDEAEKYAEKYGDFEGDEAAVKPAK